MLRFVFFDFYGTLVDILTDEGAPETSAAFARWVEARFGSEAARREREHPFVADLRAIRPPPGAHAEPDIAPVVAAHLRSILAREGSTGEIREAAEAFRAASRRELREIPGARAAVQAIGRKFGVGLISNAQLLFLEPDLGVVDLPLSLFEPALISSELGWRKPSPRLFELALEKAGIEAGQALHVGNDPLDDVEGAAGAGLRTCLVDDPRRILPAPRAPDLRLRTVADLPEALLGENPPDWAGPRRRGR